MTDNLYLAQQRREARGQDLFEQRVEYVLDKVGLSEERCLYLANFERVGPEARKKLKGLINHYRKMAHPWTACVRDNTKRFGPEGAKNICSVLTDLEKGTTKWRHGPKKTGLSEVLSCDLIDDDIAALLERVDTKALADLLAEEN